jgi:hypothetical protein
MDGLKGLGWLSVVGHRISIFIYKKKVAPFLFLFSSFSFLFLLTNTCCGATPSGQGVGE